MQEVLVLSTIICLTVYLIGNIILVRAMKQVGSMEKALQVLFYTLGMFYCIYYYIETYRSNNKRV